jgi:uncharacterized repeat protein (TIGR03803 family)
MSGYAHRLIAFGAVVVQLALFAATVSAKSPYHLHYSFTEADGDGSFPTAPLLQSDSTFYGTTQLGGIGNQFGTVFKYDSADQSESALYDFAGGTADGERPSGSVIQSGNLLYGMTFSGGTYGGGTIYSYDTTAAAEIPLYSFGAFMGDGFTPSGALIQSGTTLYGVTSSGGANATGGNDGTLFQFDTVTHAEKILYTFTNSLSDGIVPDGSLVKSGSFLYGTTSQSPGSAGTIFQFDLSSGTEKILHFFDGSGDGASPAGSLILSGSSLYGLTIGGGVDDDGTLYKYDLDTDTETVLYSFKGGATDGKFPEGALALSGSVLYGMTEEGGSFADGTIFSFDLNTDMEVPIFSSDTSTGDLASGSLTVAGNSLYGTTRAGGASNSGTVFSIDVPEPSMVGVIFVSVAFLVCRRWVRVG